ncbi:MAG TPA: cytochrome c3 family protein [Vicinamibacterales bacterium]|nr:cytochrome c3 family protein [Vicinamibacterales bacterium]
MTMWTFLFVVALTLAGPVTAVRAQDARAQAEAAFQGDVHATSGLQCASCHTTAGARRDAAADAALPRTAIAPMCSRCHSDAAYMRQFDPQVRIDQFSQYLTSAHGQAMAAGETRVATCSDCHGAHGVVRVRDTRSPVAPLNAARTCARCHADTTLMQAFGHTTTPLGDWSSGVHATALLKRGDTSAPTCHTCHGSHGATPPGVTEVANVCAQCHVREADLFRASPKKVIFDAMGQAECLVCHDNHAILPPGDALIGLAEPAVCATCHDASMNGATTITTMRDTLDRLSTTLSSARAVVDQAEHAGMLVDDARMALQTAREQQIQSRVLVHTFALESFAEAATQGIDAAENGQKEGERALEELQFRRQGLAVATLLILGFLLTLGWKIRQLGQNSSS